MDRYTLSASAEIWGETGGRRKPERQDRNEARETKVEAILAAMYPKISP